MTKRNARPASKCQCCETKPANGEGYHVGLCEDCYEEAGYENSHADGYHDEEPDANCHICQNTDPHAPVVVTEKPEAKTAGHVEGGKLIDPTTDRRLAANKHLPTRTKAERAKARREARKSQ